MRFFFFWDGGGWKGKECVPAQEVFYRNLCNVKKKKLKFNIRSVTRYSKAS